MKSINKRHFLYIFLEHSTNISKRKLSFLQRYKAFRIVLCFRAFCIWWHFLYIFLEHSTTISNRKLSFFPRYQAFYIVLGFRAFYILLFVSCYVFVRFLSLRLFVYCFCIVLGIQAFCMLYRAMFSSFWYLTMTAPRHRIPNCVIEQCFLPRF